jgi:hypothetical protein
MWIVEARWGNNFNLWICDSREQAAKLGAAIYCNGGLVTWWDMMGTDVFTPPIKEPGCRPV